MTTEQTPGAPAETNRWRRALTEITTGNALLSLLAILLAVLIGGILIGRHFRGWRGRTALRWVIASFGILLLAYVGSRFVIEVVLHRIT